MGTHRRHTFKDCRVVLCGPQRPLPTSGSSLPFPVPVVTPNIALTRGNFAKRFFTAVYLSRPLQIPPSCKANSTSSFEPEHPLQKNLSYSVSLVVKLLIRPATSLKFVHLALRSKWLDTPDIPGCTVHYLSRAYSFHRIWTPRMTLVIILLSFSLFVSE